jgi:hypothetical protein
MRVFGCDRKTRFFRQPGIGGGHGGGISRDLHRLGGVGEGETEGKRAVVEWHSVKRKSNHESTKVGKHEKMLDWIHQPYAPPFVLSYFVFS